jgi:hypothetical protein
MKVMVKNDMVNNTPKKLRWLSFQFLSALLLMVLLFGPVARPAQAANCPQLASDKGQATYTLNIPSSSTYHVWARLYPSSANNNGIYMQIDNTYCSVVIGHNSAIPANQLTWVDYGNAVNNKIGVNLSAGNHQVILAGYDPSVGVDKVLFLSDNTCAPTGDGANCTAGGSSAPASTSPSAANQTAANVASDGSASVTVDSNTKPLVVFGTVKLATAVPAGSTVVYKIDGKVVSSGTVDTTKLTDGPHTFEQIITSADGKTTIKKQALKVENGLQYQIARAVRAYWMIGILLVLILLALYLLFGPKQYIKAIRRRRLGSAAPGPKLT